MKEVYALFGKPLQHSQSPRLHNYFADQLDREIEYRLVETEPEQLEQAIVDFFAAGGSGANITAPYKQKSIDILDSISNIAATANSVNTITIIDGKLHGDNTDGVGFYRDLLHKGIDINDKRIIIIGSGGAARSIYTQLKTLGIYSIFMLQREAKPVNGDLIINATSAGLFGEIPRIAYELDLQGTICYDCNYGQASSIFLQYAQLQGATQAISGWGMLVEQAAAAFHKWTEFMPNTVEMHGITP